MTATAWLYQPFASAARRGGPTGMLGSVLSIFDDTNGSLDGAAFVYVAGHCAGRRTLST